jgi:hypothetical protein
MPLEWNRLEDSVVHQQTASAFSAAASGPTRGGLLPVAAHLDFSQFSKDIISLLLQGMHEVFSIFIIFEALRTQVTLAVNHLAPVTTRQLPSADGTTRTRTLLDTQVCYRVTPVCTPCTAFEWHANDAEIKSLTDFCSFGYTLGDYSGLLSSPV